MATATEPAGEGARRHEIPTHLDVQDRLFLGLPPRRALALFGGLACSYALWHQWPGLPAELRAGLAAACLVLTVAAVLVRPGGRGVEAWVVVALRYATVPKAAVWRPLPLPSMWPVAPTRRDASAVEAAGDWLGRVWEELAPPLQWADAHARAIGHEGEEARPWAS